jgi:hypothetical protein
MARTSQKARKSTGGTAPRKTGIALQPSMVANVSLVPPSQQCQVSEMIYLYTF